MAMKRNKRQKSQQPESRAKAKQSAQPGKKKTPREHKRRTRHDRQSQQSLPNCDTAGPEGRPSSQPAAAVAASEKSLPTTGNRGSSAGANAAPNPSDHLADSRGKVERAFTWLEAKAVLAQWARRHLRQP
jgi:outer membrane biosynthesis protein TonB